MDTRELPAIMLEEFRRKENKSFAREAYERYGLCSVNFFGLRNPEVYAIADEYYKELKSLPIETILELCNLMLATGNKECRFSAFRWASKSHKKLLPEHLSLFEKWMDNYLNDWADCDFLCTKVVGELLTRYPENISRVFGWVTSKKRFTRRAAPVSLIVPVKKHNIIPDVFAVSDALINDKDDLVQKGYGWLLKVAADRYPDDVLQFLMERKDIMPRTALRYAIEKMPEETRQMVLRKG